MAKGANMNWQRCLSFFLTIALLSGCGQKAPGPANTVVPEQTQETIPADSFLLSVEQQPASAVNNPSELKRSVTLEWSPATNHEAGKPLLLWAGPENSPLSHWSVGLPLHSRGKENGKTQIAFIIKPIQKEGTEDRFFRFALDVRYEGGEPPLASTSSDFPLIKGQTLADALMLDVKPGLYRIGSAVRLGSMRSETGDHPVTLRVYWEGVGNK
jgi:hypothetical protein